MKKIVFLMFLAFACLNQAYALNVVEKEDFLSDKLSVSGLPDYPPFSYYTKGSHGYDYTSIFLMPLLKELPHFKFEYPKVNEEDLAIKDIILKMRLGEYKIFFGAYSGTHMFDGLSLVYPAVISNPLHIITTAETHDKIHHTDDLKLFHGVVSTSEYFSDFAWRKINELNVEKVNSTYEAYEKLFTGEATYMIGSIYYNRIQAFRLGLSDYLIYSQKPLFKMPVFIAFSSLTPKLSLYLKTFKEISLKPSFAHHIKEEILRIIEEERVKNIGVVPPSFSLSASKPVDDAPQELENSAQDDTLKGGKILDKIPEEKTVQDVLEGI